MSPPSLCVDSILWRGFSTYQSGLRNRQSRIFNSRFAIRNWHFPLLRTLLLVSGAALTLFMGGCAPNMSRQPKYKALSESDFFPDGRSARIPVEGAVARGELRTNDRLYRGKTNGLFAGNEPLLVTRGFLLRGRERYDIFCSPCHGRLGDGSGMVAQRGLRRPPSYHIDRLRDVPDGYLYDVITNGFGAMQSYASRISVQDRWAITAYIRVLQLSQAAKMEDVPSSERKRLFEIEK